MKFNKKEQLYADMPKDKARMYDVIEYTDDNLIQTTEKFNQRFPKIMQEVKKDPNTPQQIHNSKEVLRKALSIYLKDMHATNRDIDDVWKVVCGLIELHHEGLGIKA
jgi:hypothetical protein